MGRKRLNINGNEEEHEEGKKISELKQDAGIPAKDPVFYKQDGEDYPLADNDKVGSIPDGATVYADATRGKWFG